MKKDMVSKLFLSAIILSCLGCSSWGHNRDACRLATEAPYGVMLYPNGLIFIGDCSIVHKWRLETGNLLFWNGRELLRDVEKGQGETLDDFAKIFRCEQGSQKILAEKLLKNRDEIFFVNEWSNSLVSKHRYGMLKIYDLLKKDEELGNVCHYYD